MSYRSILWNTIEGDSRDQRGGLGLAERQEWSLRNSSGLAPAARGNLRTKQTMPNQSRYDSTMCFWKSYFEFLLLAKGVGVRGSSKVLLKMEMFSFSFGPFLFCLNHALWVLKPFDPHASVKLSPPHVFFYPCLIWSAESKPKPLRPMWTPFCRS